MKKSLFLLSVVFLFLQGCGFSEDIGQKKLKTKTSSVVSSIPAYFIGDWDGVGYDGPYTYFIFLKIRQLGVSTYDYNYKYNNLRCRGRFELDAAKSTSQHLIFRERLNRSESSSVCLSGGVVHLERRTGNTLRFTWKPNNRSNYGNPTDLFRSGL